MGEGVEEWNYRHRSTVKLKEALSLEKAVCPRCCISLPTIVSY